jgi:hypothetical protein
MQLAVAVVDDASQIWRCFGLTLVLGRPFCLWGFTKLLRDKDRINHTFLLTRNSPARAQKYTRKHTHYTKIMCVLTDWLWVDFLFTECHSL